MAKKKKKKRAGRQKEGNEGKEEGDTPPRRGADGGARRLGQQRQPQRQPQWQAGNGAQKARSLESRLTKVSPVIVANLSLLAAYTPLERPIRAELAVLSCCRIDGGGGGGGGAAAPAAPAPAPAPAPVFRLPKKPRWHHELSAKAVQSNEESVFASWLEEMDRAVEGRFALANGLLSRRRLEAKELPRAAAAECLLPSMFERNVEMYRQLWRVMERSHLLLVLLDARCPLLHLPSSLVDHLRRYASVKTILVLTKKDLVGAEVAEAWRQWLQQRYGWTAVVTEAYQRQDTREGQSRRTRLAPSLSDHSRSAIFAALEKAHASLVAPPPNVAEDAEKAAQWRPSCATDVDWDEVQSRRQRQRSAKGDGHGAAALPRAARLCVGLIGQPNVGKSSLLNALVGSKVVHASRTPGKTKTFQTHFLGGAAAAPSTGTLPCSHSSHNTPAPLLLCDCPGLVFPSSAGQELQVLGAILPISQVQSSASILRFVASHMPLEKILHLEMPPDEDGDATLASATACRQEQGGAQERSWTATLILEALCRRHGYKTAKAGRWDVNRAGNALIRILAEGRIRWAFRPPPPPPSSSSLPLSCAPPLKSVSESPLLYQPSRQHQEEDGIWLPDTPPESSSTPSPETTPPAPASYSFLLEEEEEEEDDDDDDGEEEEEEEEREAEERKTERAGQGQRRHTSGRSSSKKVSFAVHQGDQSSEELELEQEEEEEEQQQTFAPSTTLFQALTVEGQEEEEEQADLLQEDS